MREGEGVIRLVEECEREKREGRSVTGVLTRVGLRHVKLRSDHFPTRDT